MARNMGNDFTKIEDWTDAQMLGMDPMTDIETKLWSAIVACQKRGDVKTMLSLVSLFDAIQHGDLDSRGGIPDHTKAMLYDVVEAAIDGSTRCLLTHFGLAL